MNNLMETGETPSLGPSCCFAHLILLFALHLANRGYAQLTHPKFPKEFFNGEWLSNLLVKYLTWYIKDKGGLSRRQCSVWGCHNRKGRCIEDIAGNGLCSCSVWKARNCPKSKFLALHRINSMPFSVKRAVIAKINLTRQGPKGKRWQPTKEAVICNVH